LREFQFCKDTTGGFGANKSEAIQTDPDFLTGKSKNIRNPQG